MENVMKKKGRERAKRNKIGQKRKEHGAERCRTTGEERGDGERDKCEG